MYPNTYIFNIIRKFTRKHARSECFASYTHVHIISNITCIHTFTSNKRLFPLDWNIIKLVSDIYFNVYPPKIYAWSTPHFSLHSCILSIKYRFIAPLLCNYNVTVFFIISKLQRNVRGINNFGPDMRSCSVVS